MRCTRKWRNVFEVEEDVCEREDKEKEMLVACKKEQVRLMVRVYKFFKKRIVKFSGIFKIFVKEYL